MTADLVARLEAEADFAHSLIAEAVGDRRTLLAERESLLREAASALRSSGEAVAWPDRMVNLPCPDGGTDRILGFRIPEGDPILGKFGLSEPLAWLRSVTIDRCPATPASAPDWNMAQHWIDRYAGGIDDELQLDRVAEALGLPDPTPPTSTNGG